MQNAAFIGWQIRDVVLSALNAKQRPHFQQYLTALGLTESTARKRSTGLAPKGTGTANAERVRNAFKKSGVRKT